MWRERWYRELPLGDKLLWRFVCDNCDNAGVWSKDIALASFYIGISIDESKFLALINAEKTRIKEIDPTKWFIVDFVTFQIGKLTGKKRTNLQENSLRKIKEYISLGKLTIEDYPFITAKLPVTKGYKYIGKGKGKDKDIDKGKEIIGVPPLLKDVLAYCKERNYLKEQGVSTEYRQGINTLKDKDKDKDKDKKKRVVNIPPLKADVMAYCKERKNSINAEAFMNYYDSKGWLIGKSKMKDWKAAIRTWEQRRKDDGKSTRYSEPNQQKDKYEGLERKI